MRAEERELAELARRQRQVFSREQVTAVGLGRKVISRRLVSGAWRALGPRSFAFAGTELDWRGRLQAGLFDLGEGARVTAESAAALYGLDSYHDGSLVFLVPRALRERTTVGDVISTTSIDRRDCRVVDGLPIASAALTVVQLAGRVSGELLGDAFDSACRKGLASEAAVQRLLDRIGRQGRPGMVALTEMLAGAGVESWLERQFLQLLPAELPSPALQRVYRPDGARVARVDFDFAPLPVIVEVGGRKGYVSAVDRRNKERRRNELQLLGKTVYFFTRDDIVDMPDYVVATLSRALRHTA